MTKYLIALMTAMAVLFAACGGGDDAMSTPTVAPTAAVTGTPTPKPLSGSITVFAASSLTEAFNEIGTKFKSENPGVTVTFNFGGSSDLRAQLEQGAPGDVFAAADTNQMGLAKTSGVVGSDGTVFVQQPTRRDHPEVKLRRDRHAARFGEVWGQNRAGRFDGTGREVRARS